MSANFRLCLYVISLLLNALLSALLPSIASGENQDDLLVNASAALDDELYEIAEQNIRQHLSFTTGANQLKTEYIIMLARALHGQKRCPEMLDLLQKHQQESENSALADDFSFWLALAHYANSQWADVLEQTGNFEKRHSGSALIPDIIRLRTKTLLKLGRNAEAIGTLERLIKEHKDSNETVNDRIFLGQMFANSGQTKEACAILEKLLVSAPNTSTGQKCRSILGRVYMDQKQWQKARQAYEPLISQNNIPDNYRFQAIESLATIAASQTNFSEALNILENGGRLMPNSPHSLELSLRKGALLLKMNKIDEGTVLIHDYVSAQATNALGVKVQLELAQAFLARGLNEKALVEFQFFLESFASQSDLTEAFKGKGTALFNLERYREAAAAFTRADEAGKNQEEKAQCRYRTADSLFALGQFKTAAETYTQVGGMLPDTYLAMMALFQTAECQAQLGNLPEAEIIFGIVYDTDPSDALAPRALLRIADILLLRNELRAAETIYSWINHDYEDQWQARSIYGRGMIAYRSGRFADALQCFEDTLRLAKLASNPSADGRSVPPAIRQLTDASLQSGAGGDDEVAATAAYMGGWSCFMLNKTGDARNRFSEVVRAYPHSSKAPEALFRLGEDDYNNKCYDPAESLFRRLANDYPRSPLADDAMFWAGRSALQQNEFRRGRDYFSALIKNYPSSRKRPEARYFQGVALCELGQFDAAILIFNEIIKQYPDHDLTESAAFKKADCQFILGSDEPKRYEEAINSYQLILDLPERSAAARLQAKYKIGRCLEKLGKANEAFAQYLQVVYSYLQNQDQTPSCNLWFTRAAFNAAGIMEEQQHWRKAANIYERVVETDIPASRDAQERIEKLRSEHWLSFY